MAAAWVSHAFRLMRAPGEPRRLGPLGAERAGADDRRPCSPWPASRGPSGSSPSCARPAGTCAARATFPDHHRYGRADVARPRARRRAAAGARAIVTTEKDLMRLLPFAPLPLPRAVGAARRAHRARRRVPRLAGRAARGRASRAAGRRAA